MMFDAINYMVGGNYIFKYNNMTWFAERKSRVKEAEMRAIARRARHEHSVCSDRVKTESQLIDLSGDWNVDPGTTNTSSTMVHNTPTVAR